MSVLNDLENCFISISQTENDPSMSSDSRDNTINPHKKYQNDESPSERREKGNPNLIYSKDKNHSKNKKPNYSSLTKPQVSKTNNKPVSKQEISIKNIFLDRLEYERLKSKQYVELNNLDIVIYCS
jgi:hypothetical protein